jgi:dTDP-4-amino-4,6-dideoxygalactose transaminase
MTNNKFDYRYIPVKKGSIYHMYPWYLWRIDLWVLFFKPHKNKIDKIYKNLKEYFLTKDIFFLDSGKSAIVISLKALNVKKNDEVCVSVFVCPDVIDTIITMEAKPVFIDCEENLLIDPIDLQRKINHKTKCIITTNIYGSSEKDEIYKIAKENRVKVIDDLAQSFEIIKRGNISIYSVGPKKIINTTGGGIIVTEEIDISEKINLIIPKESVSYTELVKMFIECIRYYSFFFLLKIQNIFKIKIISISKEKRPTDYLKPKYINPKKMNVRTIYSLYLKIKYYYIYKKSLEQKIDYLDNSLKKFDWIKIPQKNINNLNSYYTIRVEKGIRYKLGLYLAEHGFQTTWNYVPATWYDAYQDNKDKTPNAFSLSEKVLSLPFRGLSNKRIKKMISIISNFEKELL